MQEHIDALAANVRRFRGLHGLSLAQLAERTEISKATLFNIESRQTNPTLETMAALSGAFSVPLTDLLAPEGSAVEIVRAGEGVDISDTAVGGRMLKSLMVGSTLVEVLELTIYADSSETSISHGPGAREHVIVKRGHVLVGPLDSQVEVGPGDYATYRSDRAHRWTAVGKSDANVWVVHTFPRPIGDRSG